MASNGVGFTVLATPSITSLSAELGGGGNFGNDHGNELRGDAGNEHGQFNGMAATPTSWSATSIVAPVPAGATTGNVVVTVSGVASNGVAFTVTGDAEHHELSPTSAAGRNFGNDHGNELRGDAGNEHGQFNGTAATPTSWSATSIVGAGSGRSDDWKRGGDCSREWRATESPSPCWPLRASRHSHPRPRPVGDFGNDHGNEFRSDTGNEHGSVQRDGGDTDELERDEHRGAGSGRSDDWKRGRDGVGSGEQRSRLHRAGDAEHHELQPDVRPWWELR